jgi:ATP-dependent RNA helicase DeaD
MTFFAAMNKWVQHVLDSFGFDSLNQMQEKSIPFLTKNKSALLVAPTGSGKTLSYLIAALPHLQEHDSERIQLLVIVPTRELALQIEANVRKMKLPFKVNACYGGHAVDVETRNFRHSPTILIGTPGRLLDHIHRKNIKLKDIHTLILDEFDKSLEMGFQNDMADILTRMSYLERTWLCSATNAIEIPAFVGKQRFADLTFESNVKSRLTYYQVTGSSGKRERLYDLLDKLPTEATVIFCNQKDTTDALLYEMRDRGFDVVAFHGGLEQNKREVALARFRNKSASILVSTDLAARGLDIPELNHVIHYDLPDKEASFVHRCGRTARVARNGNVYIIPKENQQPDYTPDLTEFSTLPRSTKRSPSAWSTFYISGGKKNKINKIDLVGFFIKVGRLNKDDVGLIEVKDFASYVAIRRDKIEQVHALCSNQKIKKQKHVIEIARF